MDELLAVANNRSDQELLRQKLKKYWDSLDQDASSDSLYWEKRFERMMADIRQIPDRAIVRRSFINRKWAKIAAVAFILIGCGLIWHSQHVEKNIPPVRKVAMAGQSDIQPGGNKAVLILSNGNKIVLDSVQKGALVQQGNMQIIKVSSGLIAYNANQRSQIKNQRSEIEYNTIITPKGGQYEVILPDNSKVWLNAASSIRYPVAFNGRRRTVEITGEAYFEVAHNPSQPFTVYFPSPDGDGRKGEVQVLGTHFNIMAYPEEGAVSTTLLEGAVIVSDKNHQTLLRPGQKALIGIPNSKIKVSEADTSEAVAWKNGLFRFDQTDLRTIMRQIARWYNVEVNYSDNFSNRAYTGIMSRDVSLSHVLKVLALSNVHFKVEGKIITVYGD